MAETKPFLAIHPDVHLPLKERRALEAAGFIVVRVPPDSIRRVETLSPEPLPVGLLLREAMHVIAADTGYDSTAEKFGRRVAKALADAEQGKEKTP